MYNISQTFREAMNRFIIKPVLQGTIDGVPFTHDDILAESFRCCNQCIAVNDAKLGGVFIGELRMTLLASIADTRGGWVGKVIECYYGLETSEGEEYIPTPSKVYTIYSAEWTEQGLKIVAYDNMQKLNKTFEKEQSAGTAWAWLQYVARKTGITLGQTEAEVAAMPNGSKMLGLDSTDNIETYRDLISYLSAALSGYATINREGSLILRQFNGTIVNNIDENNRFTGCKFSDYSAKYTGLSVVNNQTGEVDYYHLNPDNGLTMKLGNNPFLQLGINQDEIRSTILNELWRYNYVPFKATLLGCCAYDLGDLIRFTGGIAANSIGCIMAYDFGFNSYSIACYGDNPALENVQTKTEKNITGLTKAKSKEELVVTNLTNINEVDISSEWTEIGSVAFSVSKKQIIIFNAVSKMNLSADGNVKYKYTLNDQELDFIHELHAHEGTDTANLFIPFSVNADTFNTLKVYVESDETSGSVEALNMRGTILGVGINISEWDGTISFVDTYSLNLIGQLNTSFIDGGAIFAEYIPDRELLADVFNMSTEGGLDISFTDGIKVTLREPEFNRITEDGDRRLTEDNDVRIT